eukprot:11183964-Lingulodinium_polyedra.AAC.1
MAKKTQAKLKGARPAIRGLRKVLNTRCVRGVRSARGERVAIRAAALQLQSLEAHGELKNASEEAAMWVSA